MQEKACVLNAYEMTRNRSKEKLVWEYVQKKNRILFGIVFAVFLVVTAAESVGAFEGAQYFEADYEDGKMNGFDYYNWDSME